MSIQDPINTVLAAATPTTTSDNTSTTPTKSSTTITLPPIQSTSLRIAVVGNVDAGKSTFVGAMVTGCRDNSRGLLRSFVCSHPHELSTGRTSASSHHIFGYNQHGQHVSFNPYVKQQGAIGSTQPIPTTVNAQTATNTQNTGTTDKTPTIQQIKVNKTKAWEHVVNNSQRVVSLLDLPGHQKYLKSTLGSIVANLPDLALVLISPNTGLSHMTIEHISLCVALRIRFLVLVTKIDRASIDVLKPLKVDINNFITQQCGRVPIMIKNEQDVNIVLGGGSHANTANTTKQVPLEQYVPIFYISSTTLQHFSLLHSYLARVKPITWVNNNNNATTADIDEIEQLLATSSLNNNDNSPTNKHCVVNTDSINDNIANEIASTPNNKVFTHNQQKFDTKTDTNTLVSATNTSPTVLNVQPSSRTSLTTSTTAVAINTINDTHSIITTSSVSQLSGNNSIYAMQSLTSFNGSTTSSGNNATNNHSVTNNTATTVYSLKQTRTTREITIPSHLQTILSGEMRVEDKFYKTNHGLIVSGTITYGQFRDQNSTAVNQKDEQIVFLGPFCSNNVAFAHNNYNAPTSVTTAPVTTVTNTTNQKNTTIGKTATSTKAKAVQNEEATLDVEFIPVTIKSIQLYRTQVTKAHIGDGVGICIKYDEKTHKLMQKQFKYKSKLNHLKDLNKQDILKGMVLIGLNFNNNIIPLSMIQTNTVVSNSLLQQFGIVEKNNTATPVDTKKTTNNKPSTALTTDTNKQEQSSLINALQFKKLQLPYELLLSSCIDIDISVLHPSSCFRKGFQIVMHCSSLVIPIAIEQVLAVIDNNSGNVLEMADNYGNNVNYNKNQTNQPTNAVKNHFHKFVNPNLPMIGHKTTDANTPTNTPPINNDILLRHNQRGILRCRFIPQPFVYIHNNEQILLRDGSTRAIGYVSGNYY